MHISRLALDHYRSWSQVVVDFVPGVNILFGKNGLGKTNLVEAVEVLSTEPASTRGRRCICAISSARFQAFPSLPKISGWYPAIREHAAS